MHLNVSILLNVSQIEASLTPRRVVREKPRVKSGSFFGIGMNPQQLGGLRQTLAPVRVKPEEMYEDTEMVRNITNAAKLRQELVNCKIF
jgi:hypothetical protein